MIHTSTYAVTFVSPFMLPGLDAPHPAGTYTITADDEDLDVSFAATRRVATTILLTSGGTTQAWPVSQADLEAALDRDAGGRRAWATRF